MSYLTEKMAYIGGLAEGLDIDETTKEGKLLMAIVEAISDIADEIDEIEEYQDEMQAQLDEVDEDLAEIEDIFYEDEDDFEEDDEFSVECPNCGDLIYLDLETLEDCDKITCPGCNIYYINNELKVNEEIEIEFDCDCENCSDCCED